MTTNTTTLSQMLDIARIVYPPTDIDDWCIYEGRVVAAYKTDEYGWVVCTAATEFNPRLINAAINTLIAGAGAAHEGYESNVRNSTNRKAHLSE